MKLNPFSKLFAINDLEGDTDEQIAQDLLAEGLSGVSADDTWLLNSRLGQHNFETHQRRSGSDRHLGLTG